MSELHQAEEAGTGHSPGPNYSSPRKRTSWVAGQTPTPTDFNPKPQMAPGAGSSIDNPVLLDVCGTQWMAGDKIVIVMVGLPARGKTHIARRLARYLSFFHNVPVEVFNVGEYRRKLCGTFMPATFFDHNDAESVSLRRRCSQAAMGDLRKYLLEREDSRVAIYDATNTTKQRRAWVKEQLSDLKSKVIFIEVMCMDEKLIDENIRAVKLNLPDYMGMDPEEAVRDFKQRITKSRPRLSPNFTPYPYPLFPITSSIPSLAPISPSVLPFPFSSPPFSSPRLLVPPPSRTGTKKCTRRLMTWRSGTCLGSR